ncbi:MAG: alpha-2-macroglobulin [Tenuifilum sp.]|jgi:hypothetical protein|uniref:alpha-2-macroglobulin family protein n=1 Tax=Tenuifilum sp. TaxID=2760880 RepID=UPI0024AAB619|nr:MG2 domain-containing protein [Tenuifilum sp.]MDI3526051.1 alpha-2-macroglobulin [Tenuifilum sp.]
MKNKRSPFLRLIVISLVGIALVTSCKKRSKEIITVVDPTFSQYVSAYTSGMVSANSTIAIRLAKPASSFTSVGDEIKTKVFNISPSVDGKAFWVDSLTIEFKPDKPLKSGEIYTIRFYLGKVTDVDDKRFENLDFSIRVIPQSIAVDFVGLIVQGADDPKTYTLEGVVQLADHANIESLKKCFKANHNGQMLDIELEQTDLKTYNISIKGIKRTSKKSIVDVTWNSEEINGSNSGSFKFDVPAIDEFSVINTKVTQSPNQSIQILFSDLLDENQDFEGLVEIDGYTNLRFELDRNLLRVYLPQETQEVGEVNVHKGIKNFEGKKLEDDYSQKFIFEDIKPSLRSVSKGTILPTSQGLVYPFEAVNLKAVTVEVIKIFENNIPYYLQVNRLGETYELRRVGYSVFRKNISLLEYGVVVPNKWTRYTLDLSNFFEADPGALYQIKITFNKYQLLNPCESDKSEVDDMSSSDEDYDDYYYDEDYDWRERDNPCNPAYYMSSRMINQIIMSSDLGVLAKMGNNGKMLVVVTDLPSAKPKSDVTIRITDYQNQLLAEDKTNSDGFAEFSLSRTPYLVTAIDGNQKGYLRVDNGSSNSLSNFDVGGFEVQRGLKGMIYGERGVWRPGDTLHLSFILEDKEKTIPENHPVIFELRDPRGTMVKKIVKPNNPMGMFYFPVPTDEQAPTGNWMARVKVGGAIFNKTLKIETIKPNRLKINLDIDNIPQSGVISAPINVKWLHGAPAGNLKAKYEVTLKKGNATFPKYSQYTFNDPGIQLESNSYTLWEGMLDANGNSTVTGKITKQRNMPAAIYVLFKGRVFEQGGDYSIDLFSKTFYPYNRFVGVLAPKPKPGMGWLETDSDQEFKVVTIDANGKPVNCNNLVVELFKLSWRWWWEQLDNSDASYVSRNYEKLVSRKEIATKNGKATFPLRINYPEWGRYYLKITDKETGVSCGKIVYFDWPWGYSKTQADRPGGASILALAINKDECNVGDKVELTFPGSEGSRALISVENGSRVIKAWWADASKANNVVEVETTPEMAPNAFIHVTLIQPHKNKSNDLPIRMFGITQVVVSDPQTILQPIIDMPDEIKTNQTFTVSVSEKNGKPMNFTLAIVDEGLLDINRFKTPDPHSIFYAQEALGVRTWDIYDYVIGAFGGKLERNISIGGDEDVNVQEGEKNQRFKPVVRYFGPFSLGKSDRKKISVNLGNYIGSVRAMVVAANNGAYGNSEKACPVRNDLMVMATLPRVLGPQEEISLPVNIFTMSNKVKDVLVKVKTTPNVSIVGETQKPLSFRKEGEKMVYFNLRVGGNTGNAKITVEATGNEAKAYQTIDISIRNPISEVTRSIDTIVPANSKISGSFNTFGIPGSNSATIEASILPPLNLKRRLDELIRYPHGCVEQTTSAVFPQIYLDKQIELTSDQKGNINYYVNEAIAKLSKLQNTDGSFRYWPSYNYSDDWSTSYVGHFLVEAQEAGFNIPQSILSNWLAYQRGAAREYRHTSNSYRNSDLVQAYRLYTLALAQSPEIGAMNKLKEQSLGLAAKMRLAAAYALIGQEETAKSIIQNTPIKFDPYRELSYTYGSDLRDKAITLETLILLNDETNGFRLAKEISKSLSGNRWLSTQETATSLLALSKMSLNYKEDGKVNVRYTINGETEKLSTSKPIARNELNIKDGSNTFTYENRSSKPVFVNIALSGIPPLGEEKAFESNITMKIVYKDNGGILLNPEQLKKGTDFICEVTISNPGTKGEIKGLALTQIFPSGWEIQNTRLEGTDDMSSNKFDYQDIRDDRVITYIGLRPNETKKFTIKLTATYAGKFYMPGPYCEAMYDNSIAAQQKGGWVKVE